MKKRLCKNSGMKLSVLGTGCWAFGGGEYWGKQDQKDVNEVVFASVDLGINYFDTAEAYNEGRSETSLGEAIKGMPRDKILVPK
jgi:myo-inositol catabolism protein IolS